jgi:hypothetical protein
MHLYCKVCAAKQPVTTADAEDEDPRTAGIRRAFRAEHIASCGEASVSLVLHDIEATHVDPQLWNLYLAHAKPPTDVTAGGDGYFVREIMRDGRIHNVRVCEDCWENIPRYIDFPQGLTAPESDGPGAVVPKMKPDTVETDSPLRAAGAKHLSKAVCLPCYLAAFTRVYPDAALPQLNADVIGDGAPVEIAPPPSAEVLGRVTVNRWDKEQVGA